MVAYILMTKMGRSAVGQTGIIAVKEKDSGWMKADVLEDGEGETITMFVCEKSFRELRSLLMIKKGYVHLGGKYGGEYRHKTFSHSAKEFGNSIAHTNGMKVFGLFSKRGFNGVYHNWSKRHWRVCMNEFTYRLIEGNC